MNDDISWQKVSDNYGDYSPIDEFLSYPYSAMVGFNSGIEHLTHGMLQPLLESGYLGDAVSNASKHVANQRKSDYEEQYRINPRTTSLSQVAGETGAVIPLFVASDNGILPGLASLSRFLSAPRAAKALGYGLKSSDMNPLVSATAGNALAGGLGGAAQYTEGDDSRVKNAAINALLGSLLGTSYNLFGRGAQAASSKSADDFFTQALRNNQQNYTRFTPDDLNYYTPGYSRFDAGD